MEDDTETCYLCGGTGEYISTLAPDDEIVNKCICQHEEEINEDYIDDEIEAVDLEELEEIII